MLTLTLLVLVLAALHVDGMQYCRISRQHTMCKSTGIGLACGGGLYTNGVDNQDIAKIVDAHNSIRALVATGMGTALGESRLPPAANMMEIVWDPELASIAQKHADQCVFQHDCALCRQVDRFPVGQNLFISASNIFDYAADWSGVIQSWIQEIKKQPINIDSYSYSPTSGHASQLLWATTHKIGCGFSLYKEQGLYKKLYVCNYGPAGNVVTKPVYSTGLPCSKCPLSYQCSTQGLCASDDQPTFQVKNLLTSFGLPMQLFLPTSTTSKTQNSIYDTLILPKQSTSAKDLKSINILNSFVGPLQPLDNIEQNLLPNNSLLSTFGLGKPKSYIFQFPLGSPQPLHTSNDGFKIPLGGGPLQHSGLTVPNHQNYVPMNLFLPPPEKKPLKASYFDDYDYSSLFDYLSGDLSVVDNHGNEMSAAPLEIPLPQLGPQQPQDGSSQEPLKLLQSLLGLPQSPLGSSLLSLGETRSKYESPQSVLGSLQLPPVSSQSLKLPQAVFSTLQLPYGSTQSSFGTTQPKDLSKAGFDLSFITHLLGFDKF